MPGLSSPIRWLGGAAFPLRDALESERRVGVCRVVKDARSGGTHRGELDQQRSHRLEVEALEDVFGMRVAGWNVDPLGHDRLGVAALAEVVGLALLSGDVGIGVR